MRLCITVFSAVFAAALSVAQPDTARNAEKIAVLVTDWTEPEGIDPLYRR